MSGYPPEMMASIERVQATRQRRLAERFESMPASERDTVLRRFHPDYVHENMREVRVGVSKGQRMPLELANVLEGNPLIGDDYDLHTSAHRADVLVIGGGGAGAAAALAAQEAGASVTLVTKLRFGDANTMMAQGGIQAADRPVDSPATHYLDVMGGGHFTNDPSLVEALVIDAPGAILWLERLGAMFDKHADGSMVERHGGGTSRMRMHSARDYTGAEIMRTLRDEVRNRGSDITVIEFSPAVELALDDRGHAAGAVVLNLETGAFSTVEANAIVLATGGGGRLHYQGYPTTNHYGATADGVVLAYRAGAPIGFLESMQYHPTGAAFPEQIVGLLVTEKVRGLGAQPVNRLGEQFVYPLEPRDVEAAALIRECREREKGVATYRGQHGIWLDSPMIDLIHGEGTIAKNLPAMVRQFGRFGIDIRHEPILVYPTLHYQNGGVLLRPDGSTAVPGLFVAGEISGGVHGHNRLMGNSLLEITVFGRRAGSASARHALATSPGRPTLRHLDAWNRERAKAGIETDIPAPVLLPDYTRRM